MASDHLHPESRAYLQSIASGNSSNDQTAENSEPPPTPALTLAGMREYIHTFYLDNYQFSAGVKFELFIPTPDPSYRIPVYVYRPNSHDNNPPVLIYFHGGGLVSGSYDWVDGLCKRLCDTCQCLVVNVEYRYYPEYDLYAPFDDVIRVTEWVKSNVQLIGGGPRSKIGVAGDSAGGRLAAIVAHDVKGLAFQLLIYAFVSNSREYSSFYEIRNDGTAISSEVFEWIEQYGVYKPDPRCIPNNRVDFTDLPPALFIVATADQLKDQNYEYAKKLQNSNVPCEIYTYEGILHGFFTNPVTYPETCKAAYGVTCEFIKRYGSATEVTS